MKSPFFLSFFFKTFKRKTEIETFVIITPKQFHHNLKYRIHIYITQILTNFVNANTPTKEGNKMTRNSTYRVEDHPCRR